MLYDIICLKYKGGEILKAFDCVVVGQDLYALTVALFLSRKMRKVLIIQDSTAVKNDFEKINIKHEDKNYRFSYNRNNIASGLEKSGLLYAYLDSLGLEKNLEYEKNTYEMIFDQKGNLKKRYNSFEEFRVYLVRNYPKNRKEIHDFFEILDRHYQNYMEQHLNMLRNSDYTLTSLMIEWGDYSLGELLSKFFTNEDLIGEFLVNDLINGLPIQEINAYSFFSNYFVGLKTGFFYLRNSYQEICNKCVEKIKLVNPNAFLDSHVKEYVVNEKKEIECIIDGENNLIYAKYFFVSDNPVSFYTKYFKGLDDDIEIIKAYYPNINTTKRINSLYLALNTKLSDVGLDDLVYIFNNDKDDEIKLTRMYNYTVGYNQDLRRKEGLLCIDFTYDEDIKVSKEMLLKKIDFYLPKIKKYIVGFKLGKPSPYLSMIRDEKLRRHLSINELIDLESLEHIQVFENLFLGGEFIRPEAKFNGIINQSIVFADKIEDKLYYGDNEDDFEYFTNDEIMMMIRHNYQHQYFGNKEIHVNFHIGKSNYFVRTKGKNIVIHQGKYNNADLSIYTTNDKLTTLLLKKSTFNEILESGFLKYRGDIDLLFTAVKAFQLDDYQEYSQEDYLTSRYKFLGVKMLFAHIFIYAIAAFLSNFYLNIYIFPAALLLSLLISFVKIKVFEKTSWFEIVLNIVLLAFSALSIFVSRFNSMLSDDIFLGVIILILLVSVFVNRPVVFLYHQFDMNIDYRNTKLFKTITNGLTFIWGFIFMVILGGTYIAGERYVSVFYSFLFMGIFLTYYYPTIYVRTSIKK